MRIEFDNEVLSATVALKRGHFGSSQAQVMGDVVMQGTGKPFHFADAMIARSRAIGSILVVGLDPQLGSIPRHLLTEAVKKYGRTYQAICHAILDFHLRIVDAVADVAVAVKPNIAFVEQYGKWGYVAHEQVIAHVRKKGLLVITDAKRNDGGPTADAYANAHIGRVLFWGEKETPLAFTAVEGPLRVDALTVTPAIGDACVEPFVKRVARHGTGIFLVTRTSFGEKSRFEDRVLKSGRKNWQDVALQAKKWGEGTEGEAGFSNVGVVFGATRAADAEWMKTKLPRVLKLIPGYGAQGGGADGAIAATDESGQGGFVNSSRGIIYASNGEDFAEAAGRAARAARDDLNAALKSAGKDPYR